MHFAGSKYTHGAQGNVAAAPEIRIVGGLESRSMRHPASGNTLAPGSLRENNERWNNKIAALQRGRECHGPRIAGQACDRDWRQSGHWQGHCAGIGSRRGRCGDRGAEQGGSGGDGAGAGCRDEPAHRSARSRCHQQGAGGPHGRRGGAATGRPAHPGQQRVRTRGLGHRDRPDRNRHRRGFAAGFQREVCGSAALFPRCHPVHEDGRAGAASSTSAAATPATPAISAGAPAMPAWCT